VNPIGQKRREGDTLNCVLLNTERRKTIKEKKKSSGNQGKARASLPEGEGRGSSKRGDKRSNFGGGT